LNIYRACYGDDSEYLTYPMADWGLLLLKKGEPERAEPLLREAWRIRREKLLAGDWRTANAQSLLGECLAAMGKYEEAEPLLLDGYHALHASPETSPGLVDEAIRRIIEMYESWGKPEQAAGFRQLQVQGFEPAQSDSP
jgi:hypothetical protein